MRSYFLLLLAVFPFIATGTMAQQTVPYPSPWGPPGVIILPPYPPPHFPPGHCPWWVQGCQTDDPSRPTIPVLPQAVPGPLFPVPVPPAAPLVAPSFPGKPVEVL